MSEEQQSATTGEAPQPQQAPSAQAEPVAQPQPQPAPQPERAKQGNLAAYSALVLALASLGLAGWLVWDTRAQLAGIQQEVGRKLADADSTAKQTQGLASAAREDVRQALAKLTVLESKLAESQSQQIALEALYQELARGRDEGALAEVEQTLEIASQQLQLAGNVKAALIALQAADARLARADKPQWIPLRRAINQDMERLRALPYVDTVAISVKLDNLIAGVDKLPIAGMASLQAESARDAEAASYWARFGKDIWQDLKQLVRIRNLEKPEVPLLPPEQTYFLRENLKLRLVGARLAVLARDETSYREDLKAAQEWIARYFDTGARPTAAALATLKQLADSPIGIAPPNINASLDALSKARQAREKAGR